MKHLLYIFVALLIAQCAYAQTAVEPSAGDGSSGNPYQISSLENLYWIATGEGNTRVSKHYIQIQDINAAETAAWSEGWVLIGNGSPYSFSGSYNGQDFVIDSLYINSSVGFQGLFGSVGTGGTIENLGVTNVNITAGNNFAGALAASVSGSSTIKNCYSTGTVSGTGFIGGLVGSNNGTINNCYSECVVNASSQAGGLSGRNAAGGTISNSYATGNVITTGSWSGGFVGFNFEAATISNCYSRGNVTRSSGTVTTIAGFVGWNNGSTIQYCFSTGTVNYGSDKGFVGLSENSPVYIGNFFDTQTSGQTSGVGADAKNTEAMTTNSTFLDNAWSGSIWNIGDGINDGYPYLKWQNPGGTPLPVELVSFAASAQQNGIELQWKTATEANNYGFEIERAIDNGKLKMDNWSKAGFVEGHGTTNAPKEYSFTDKNLKAGKYSYRLKQIDRDGKFSYSQEIEVNVSSQIPQIFSLEQNYPNPFNPTTTIGFTLHGSGFTSLKVYDAVGREVATLVNEVKDAGYYDVKFDASKLSSGIYFARLSSSGKSQIRKLLLMK